jgi:hypothetical protein
VATAPIEHVAPVEQAVAAHHVAPVEHLESEPVSTGEAVETPQHVS